MALVGLATTNPRRSLELLPLFGFIDLRLSRLSAPDTAVYTAVDLLEYTRICWAGLPSQRTGTKFKFTRKFSTGTESLWCHGRKFTQTSECLNFLIYSRNNVW